MLLCITWKEGCCALSSLHIAKLQYLFEIVPITCENIYKKRRKSFSLLIMMEKYSHESTWFSDKNAIFALISREMAWKLLSFPYVT